MQHIRRGVVWALAGGLHALLLPLATALFAFVQGFLVVVVVLGVAALLGFLSRIFSEWASFEKEQMVKFVALSPCLGIFISTVIVSVLYRVAQRLATLQTETGSLAGLSDLLTVNPFQYLTFVFLIYALASYVNIFPLLQQGEKRDFLWIALPIGVFLFAASLGWLQPFDAWFVQ
ncbi:MAG: hypothetical protein OXR66_09575 [Candidatus Woesearchaeota archaeon]|nr:hypothetical protein [Candidatus Woesearchaeota archaeon]